MAWRRKQRWAGRSGTSRAGSRRVSTSSERAVRLVVVSKRLQANRAVCIERLEIVPLDAGVVIGSDFVNRPAIAEALREAFSRLPARGSLRTLRCAMALPSSATLTAQVPLKKLTRVSPFVATGA